MDLYCGRCALSLLDQVPHPTPVGMVHSLQWAELRADGALSLQGLTCLSEVDGVKDLDRVLHQPVRTRIVAYLVSVQECDYTTLKKALGLSDGHMSTHMKELLGSGYLEMEKSFVQNKPRTTYRLTKTGKKRFGEYVSILKSLIELA